MRATLLALLLAGCNSFYGLDETRGRDAAPKEFFDAPPDAPFACPGAGVPRFRMTLGQVPVGACQSYTLSHDANTAVAHCQGTGIVQGPIDGPMTLLIDDDVELLYEPRLFPEGDRMFVKDGARNRVDIYAREGTMWSAKQTIRPSATGDWYISNPSRGPDRRAIVLEVTSLGYSVTELVEQGTDWVAKPSYKLNNVTYGTYPSLSSDALRLVFSATSIEGAFYASRAHRDAPFDNPQSLATLPRQAAFPFLEDDCSRVYFSALDTVLYLTLE